MTRAMPITIAQRTVVLVPGLVWSLSAYAGSDLRTEDGTALRWSEDNPWTDGVYLPIAGNLLSVTGIDGEALQATVTAALSQWQAASGDTISWDYWQGTDTEIFRPVIEHDGLSSIFFASASDLDSMDAGTAAYTQVWHDDAGEIVELDMVLNDQSLFFTTDPTQATYTQEGQLGRTLLLQDVLTHELGHGLGLGHSGLLDSTMFTWSWADQQSLGCDDIAQLRALYDVDDLERGSLVGSVTAPNASPLAGADVVAISLDARQPVGSAVSGLDGRWRIDGLDEGDYLLMVEPFSGGVDALGELWSGVDTRRCGELDFGRTFVQDPDRGGLAWHSVVADEITTVPTVQVSCSQGGMLTVSDPPGGPSADQAGVIAWGEGSFAQVDVALSGPDDSWVALRDVQGHLSMTLLSYSLSSPVRVEPVLYDSELNLVSGVTILAPTVQSDTSGFASWDSRLDVDLPQRGDYLVRLESNLLATNLTPIAADKLETTQFVLLMGRIEAAPLPAQGQTDLNDPCALPRRLEPYLSPEGDPRRRRVEGSLPPAGCQAMPSSAAFCALLWAVTLVELRRRR